MPPMVSDDETGSDDLDTIPSKPTKKPAKADTPEEEEEEDGSSDNDTYAVEAITDHKWRPDGVLVFHVKWLGYENESDKTWEPKENLVDGANDILQDYYRRVGGDPAKNKPKPKSAKGTKRKAADTPASPAPTPPPKRGRGAPKQKTDKDGLPVGSWEESVEVIDTISDDPNKEGLTVWMRFTNGKKVSADMAQVRQKCPQKLLDYYESHLSFKDPAADGEDARMGNGGDESADLSD